MPVSQLSGAKTLDDVSAFLNVKPNFLRFVLYGRQDRKLYRQFSIPKKNGDSRTISAPPESLKIMQRKLADALLELYPPKPSVHGFLKCRSIVTNAFPHVRQRVVANLDLKDFFPSIHLGRIANALLAPPYSLGKQAATVVSQICTDKDGKLPQGAPSSPIISNIVCRRFDEDLQKVARANGFRFTRYCDDITFSSSRPKLPPALFTVDTTSSQLVVGSTLREIVVSAGFAVNDAKVRMANSNERQQVTGLTTNESPNLQRLFVRDIDSILHFWRRFGIDEASRRYSMDQSVAFGATNLRNSIKGKLSYLMMVKGRDDPVCRRLQYFISDLADSNIQPPVDLTDVQPSPLRGYRGLFRGWETIANRYVESVLFVEIKTNDALHMGTGFVVAPNILISAGHNAAAGCVRVYKQQDTLYPRQIFYVVKTRGRDYAILEFEGEPFRDCATFSFQYRLPEIGEEVIAVGFPRIPLREETVVVHSGTIEALPKGLGGDRFLQTSFNSGGGLSGGPLVDKRGFVLGLMVESVFMPVSDATAEPAPPRPYGQAVPFEYVARSLTCFRQHGSQGLIEQGMSQKGAEVNRDGFNA